MGFAQAGVVAGEGKAVTGDRPRAGEKKGCDAPGSIDPVAGENGRWGAERRSVQRSRLRCSVPGMPVVGKAANRVTWNHFFAPRTPVAKKPAAPQVRFESARAPICARGHVRPLGAGHPFRLTDCQREKRARC